MEGFVHSASTEAKCELPDSICALTHSRLDVDDIVSSVKDDGAGAIATFIGTTRNSFQSKIVTKLEYQAYSKLAIKTITQIIQDARKLSQRSERQTHDEKKPAVPLIKCAVYHRLGPVPVGEASIVIAVSSPHRREAFEACEYILEEVKRKAQIWKREFYEGEDESTASWKENA